MFLILHESDFDEETLGRLRVLAHGSDESFLRICQLAPSDHWYCWEPMATQRIAFPVIARNANKEPNLV
jgi:hypothetical protein